MFDQFNDADAMIRANGEAERLERERLAGEVEEYRRRLEELTSMLEDRNSSMNELNAMNQVNADGLKAMIQESGEEDNDEANELLSSLLGRQPDTGTPDTVTPDTVTPASGVPASGVPASGGSDGAYPAADTGVTASGVPAGNAAGQYQAAAEQPVKSEAPAAAPYAPGAAQEAAQDVRGAAQEAAQDIRGAAPAAAEQAVPDAAPEPVRAGSEEEFIRNLLFGLGGADEQPAAADSGNTAKPDQSDAGETRGAVPEDLIGKLSELLEANRAAIAEDIAGLVRSNPSLTRKDIAELLAEQPRLSRKDVSEILGAQPRVTASEIRAIVASQPTLTASDVRGVLASMPTLTAEEVEEIVKRAPAVKPEDLEALRAVPADEEGLGERLSSRLDDLENKAAERLDEADKKTYHTGVQVYRNVQASMIEELDHQTKALEQSISEVKDNQKALEESMKRLEAHIKVVEEINEEDEEMDDELYGLVKATLIISVISLILTSLHAIGVTDALLRLLGLE